jgi:ATP-dependent DNA helicase RecG
VILDAQRYGLGQLHQLRGRVGRGSRKSYCILAADGKSGEDARKRLQILMKTSSGFEIAEEDLKIRGPGDFAGVRQSGLPDVKFLDIVRDFKIIKKAREEAFQLEKDDPDLSRKENILIREKLHEKYKKIWDIIH